MKRGAQLYDLFMTMRHERDLTRNLKAERGVSLWSIACQLAAEWKAEDEKDRAGRRSWQYVPKLVMAGTFARLAAKLVGIDRTGRFQK
jgi:hypothetical protein